MAGKNRAAWSVLVATCASLVFSGALFAADIENGAEVFKRCRACHLVGDNAKNAIGPTLNKIIGRKAASVEGFVYSDNMKELGQTGLVWNDDELGRYLENPKAVAPKGKMAFPGLKDEAERADVIAYLKTFSK